MNVVIGPNGTGKSTLVSAIAVAMGASLKVLERADSYAQLILHGETEGYAEVELAGGYNPAKRTGGVSQVRFAPFFPLDLPRSLVLPPRVSLSLLSLPSPPLFPNQPQRAQLTLFLVFQNSHAPTHSGPTS